MKEAEMLILRLNGAWKKLDTVQMTTPDLSPQLQTAITEAKKVMFDAMAVFAHFEEITLELAQQNQAPS
jgi:hypothetical protein